MVSSAGEQPSLKTSVESVPPSQWAIDNWKRSFLRSWCSGTAQITLPGITQGFYTYTREGGAVADRSALQSAQGDAIESRGGQIRFVEIDRCTHLGAIGVAFRWRGFRTVRTVTVGNTTIQLLYPRVSFSSRSYRASAPPVPGLSMIVHFVPIETSRPLCIADSSIDELWKRLSCPERAILLFTIVEDVFQLLSSA